MEPVNEIWIDRLGYDFVEVGTAAALHSQLSLNVLTSRAETEYFPLLNSALPTNNLKYTLYG
jgi:hypothetical protein